MPPVIWLDLSPCRAVEGLPETKAGIPDLGFSGGGFRSDLIGRHDLERAEHRARGPVCLLGEAQRHHELEYAPTIRSCQGDFRRRRIPAAPPTRCIRWRPTPSATTAQRSGPPESLRRRPLRRLWCRHDRRRAGTALEFPPELAAGGRGRAPSVGVMRWQRDCVRTRCRRSRQSCIGSV